MKKIYDNDYVDGLIDIIYNVELDSKVTILTGSNGSGKSLIRRQLPFGVAEKLGLDRSTKGIVKSVSMDTRTSLNAEFGALSSMMHDIDWLPTSLQTFSLIESLINGADKVSEPFYLVIDEPELGMGEETQLALIQWLNEKIEQVKSKLLGVMIITHSRVIVEHINNDIFINLDGYKTKEEWLNREIIPTDLKALDENVLYSIIRKRNKS